MNQFVLHSLTGVIIFYSGLKINDTTQKSWKIQNMYSNFPTYFLF